MKYGNTTYKEDDLIERTTKALESRLEGVEGNDLILQLKSGKVAQIHNFGPKDGPKIYEVYIDKRRVRVCPDAITIAITLLGYTYKVFPQYRGW